MAHSGYGFARRSYHTLNHTVCPRRAYLTQMLGIRRRERPDELEDGPFGAGKTFHSLCEVHYTPDRYKGKPLLGTDGNPRLSTVEEVIAWYEHVATPQAVSTAWDGWLRYVEIRGDDAELRDRVVGRPEPDVVGDLRSIMPPKTAARYAGHNGTYMAQFDMIVRAPRGKSVIGVEHKLLKTFTPGTLSTYQNSGQLVGQVAVWNSREDLVEKFGPMSSVLLNLVFKTGTLFCHRESIAIPVQWQRAYARAVCEANREVDTRLQRYEKASLRPSTAIIDRIWPMTGIVRGQCTSLYGNCSFTDLCRSGTVEPELYQITEAGKAAAMRDGVVLVTPHVKVYDGP